MSLIQSTGHAKYVHGTGSIKECYTGGAIDVYGGPVPTTADAATTGATKLYTITNDAKTAAAKQKITFTPTPGSANAADWNIILNGISFSFTDGGSPSATEICNGLRVIITAGMGGTITTSGGIIGIPKVASAFTLTGTDTLIIESATAGVPFTYSASVTGAGAGSGSWSTAETVADAFGLQFEDAGDIASGKLTKLASQKWAGDAVADGNPSFFRLRRSGADSSTLSTSSERLQGTVSTVPGADMLIRHATVYTDERQDCTAASFNIPLT